MTAGNQANDQTGWMNDPRLRPANAPDHSVNHIQHRSRQDKGKKTLKNSLIEMATNGSSSIGASTTWSFSNLGIGIPG